MFRSAARLSGGSGSVLLPPGLSDHAPADGSVQPPERFLPVSVQSLRSPAPPQGGREYFPDLPEQWFLRAAAPVCPVHFQDHRHVPPGGGHQLAAVKHLGQHEA